MSNVLGRKPGSRLVSFLMVLFVLTLGIGIGTLITYRAGAGGPGDSQLKIQTDGKPLVGDAVLSLSQAFEEVARRVEPAVVNINTEEVVDLRRRSQPDEEGMPEWFHRYFPNQPEQFVRRSLGSGVIVDPKGYIITNSHVVEGARKIKVSLLGGEDYNAKTIATDSLSDIAVIKIEGTKEFPHARIGNSKAMKVGDWVLAIGSPFGLDQTVTAGIISASGRVFDPDNGRYEMLFNDYLQTDAAINPGNSGGPLVNMNGEVVGINSFISTASRSNAGVGFAVPSHIFVNVYNQILDKGKFARGYLGVSMNTLPFTPAMARYFGVKDGAGVLITSLSDGLGKDAETGPAARAGIKPEDVIVEIDGKKIRGVQDLRLTVANTPPGSTIPVKAIRKGVEKTFQVTVAERTLENQEAEEGSLSFEEPETPKTEIGLTLNEIPPRVAKDLGIPGGALVEDVKPGSLADEAGLVGQGRNRIGDIVVEANGQQIKVAQDLFRMVKDLKQGEAVVLKFLRLQGEQAMTFYTSITKP